MPVALPAIAHLDADAFFVSVEQAIDPSLRGRKVAVGGRERGIISSASYEARACGVYTPMPTRRALAVCPDLVLVPHRAGTYGEYSRRLFDLCETLTPLVERRSIDEGFLDLGPCGFRDSPALEAAVRCLQARIRDDLGLPVSFGLAANKLVAAIASKLRKPGGFVVVAPGMEAAFLAPLEVGRLPGIGPKTEAALRRDGMATIADLRLAPPAVLRAHFGEGGEAVLAMAEGRDDSRVETEAAEAKSYSMQETFAADIADRARIEREVKRMIDELAPRLRADGKRARTITLRVRYPGMENATAAHTLPAASDLETDFYPCVPALLRSAWRRRQPLRLVGVRFSGVEAPGGQLELFGEAAERRHRLAAAVDALRRARGDAAVVRGHHLGPQ